MSQGLVTDTYLTNLANAIRSKLGTQDTYTPAQMADAIRSIGGSTPPEIVSWASGTDEQLAAMIAYAHENPSWSLETDGGWSVGDVRTINISAFSAGTNNGNPQNHAQQDIDIVISSFDEYMSCENVMQFDFKDGLLEENDMNPTNTTVGGYGATNIYTEVLPALVNALPTWLKNALIEFSVLTGAGNGSTTIETVTGNKLALRSAIELGYDSSGYSKFASGEGTTLPYYSISSNRIKKQGHTGSAGYWWGRSPSTRSTNYFCRVRDSGTVESKQAKGGQCVAPFGCL